MGWSALVTVVPEPWRVTAVEDGNPQGAEWRITLGNHTVDLPGEIRVAKIGGRWAELERVALEWKISAQLPPLPDLPLCVFEDRQ